jgi:hypothetical protein
MGRTASTSLWTVIEGMQLSLEAEGLDAAVVDAAVKRGIEALLRKRPGRDGEPARLFPVGSLADA